MNYEVVTIPEKTVIGLSARLELQSPEETNTIGELWFKFHGEGIYESIPGKVNQKALGVYSGYANNGNAYDITVGCETMPGTPAPDRTVTLTIPAGTYAKFVVRGHMQQAVVDFWDALWKTDPGFERAFAYDFEEYQNEDMDNAEIQIYISIKQAA